MHYVRRGGRRENCLGSARYAHQLAGLLTGELSGHSQVCTPAGTVVEIRQMGELSGISLVCTPSDWIVERMLMGELSHASIIKINNRDTEVGVAESWKYDKYVQGKAKCSMGTREEWRQTWLGTQVGVGKDTDRRAVLFPCVDQRDYVYIIGLLFMWMLYSYIYIIYTHIYIVTFLL